MKRLAILAFAVLLFAGGSLNAFAQQTSDGPPPTSPPALPPLNWPKDIPVVAKLNTNLAGRQCKPGDPVEAEVKQDVKQGHDVLLKKGSLVTGHVGGVTQPTSDKQLSVPIAFDTARMKDGKQFSVRLRIQALAPEVEITNNDTLMEGRGMDAATNKAKVSGHDSTLKANHGMVDTKSAGVYDIPGLELAYKVTSGTQYSLLISSAGDFKLKKGTQLVLKAVN